MSFTTAWFGQGAKGLVGPTSSKRVDWASDDIRVALVAAAWTPDLDTHATFADVTNEASGAGYTSGGAALSGKSLSYDSANNRVVMDATDLTWNPLTATFRYGVIYKRVDATASNNPLLALIDMGSTQTITGVSFSIVWESTGVLNMTV